MLFFCAMMCFLRFVRFFRCHWLHRCCRTDEALSIHSTVRIKPCSKNKPGPMTATVRNHTKTQGFSPKSYCFSALSVRNHTQTHKGRTVPFPGRFSSAGDIRLYGKVSAARFPGETSSPADILHRSYPAYTGNLRLHRILHPLQALQ